MKEKKYFTLFLCYIVTLFITSFFQFKISFTTPIHFYIDTAYDFFDNPVYILLHSKVNIAFLLMTSFYAYSLIRIYTDFRDVNSFTEIDIVKLHLLFLFFSVFTSSLLSTAYLQFGFGVDILENEFIYYLFVSVR